MATCLWPRGDRYRQVSLYNNNNIIIIIMHNYQLNKDSKFTVKHNKG